MALQAMPLYQPPKKPTAVGTYVQPNTAPQMPGMGDANPPGPAPTGTGTNSPTGAGTSSDPLGVAGTGNQTPTPQSLAPKGPATPDSPPGTTAPNTPASTPAPAMKAPGAPSDVGSMLPQVNTTLPPSFAPTGSQFGPGNDLRFQTILPQTSQRTAGTQGLVDAAANQVAGQNLPSAIGSFTDQFAARLPNGQVAMPGVNTTVQGGPAVDPNASPELQRFQQLQDQAANAVGNGASRQSIALQQLQAFDQAAQPGLRDAERQVGQNAARFGRIGMGDTSVEALRPYTDYLTQRAAMEKQLAADTAAGDIQDRLNNLSATQGLVGQQAGIESGLRGEQRTERGYTTDLASQNLARQTAERNAQTGQANLNADRAYQSAANALGLGIGAAGQQASDQRANTGLLSGLEGQQTAEDVANQNATRGERQYQSDTAQQATQNALQQYLAQLQGQGQQFNQGAQLASLGLGGNAINSILQNAGLSGANASSAYDAIAKLLGPYLTKPAGG